MVEITSDSQDYNMNIHEYQAKEIIRKFGAPTPYGEVIVSMHEFDSAYAKLKSGKVVIKHKFMLLVGLKQVE